MAFCKYCGQPVADGAICDCPKAQAQLNAQKQGNYFDPTEYERQTKTEEEKLPNPESEVKDVGKKIGEGVNKGIDFIKKTSEKIKDNNDKHENSEENNTYFERNAKIVPDIICANAGEKPIRQYDFAKLRTRLLFQRAEGRLQVTNKRLIFRAPGKSPAGKTVIHSEFEISDIAGIEVIKKHRLNFINMLLAAIFTGIVGAIGFFAAMWVLDKFKDTKFLEIMSIIASLIAVAGVVAIHLYCRKTGSYRLYYPVRQALLAIPFGAMLQYNMSWGSDLDSGAYIFFMAISGLGLVINLFLMSFAPDLEVKIKSNGGLPSMHIRRMPETGLLNFFLGSFINLMPASEEYTGYLEVLPWKDTDKAIKELGTIIDDINTMGDAAIEKWAE